MTSSRSSYWLIGLLIASAIIVASFRSGVLYWLGDMYPGTRETGVDSTEPIRWVTLQIDCALSETPMPDPGRLQVGVATVEQALALFDRCDQRVAPFFPPPDYSGVIALVSSTSRTLPNLVFQDGILSEIVKKQ